MEYSFEPDYFEDDEENDISFRDGLRQTYSKFVSRDKPCREWAIQFHWGYLIALATGLIILSFIVDLIQGNVHLIFFK